MILTVKCPNCGNKQKCQPRGNPKGKVKRCVYCGRNFTIYSNINNNRIVQKS